MAAVLAVCLAVAVLAFLEEGLPEAVGHAGHMVARLLPRFGPPASFIGLYLEESGVPLPVPGDVMVLFLGHQFSSQTWKLAVAWLGLIATTVAGSTNLYLISRRWGRPLVETWFGPMLDLTPERLARVEGWFGRWGPLAIIFGRHIFGFRVPVTVAAGLFGVPYRIFVISVAISTAPWAAAWIWAGATFGGRLGRFVHFHWWSYLVFPAGFLLLVGLAIWRSWRRRRA